MNIIDVLFILGVTCLVVAYFEDNRRGKIERFEKATQDSIKARKYHWNPKSYRYELEPHQLEALSFKEITPREMYKVSGTIEYNPTYYYKDKIKLMPRELGHDLEYRYIAKVILKRT